MKRITLFVSLFLLLSNLLAQKPGLELPLEKGYEYLLTVGYGGVVCPQMNGGIDQYHLGNNYYALDFGRPPNCAEPKILAAAAGTVIVSRNDPNGYGEFIIIDHGNGYTTIYAHFKTRFKQVNNYVQQGEVLGVMGTTGISTGPHLHFALKKGESSVLPEPMSGYTNFTPGHYYKAGDYYVPPVPQDIKDKIDNFFYAHGLSLIHISEPTRPY